MSKYGCVLGAFLFVLIFGACEEKSSEPTKEYPLPENGDLAIFQTGGMFEYRPVRAVVNIPGYGEYYDIQFKYSGEQLQAMHYYSGEELSVVKAFFYSPIGKLESVRINGYQAYTLEYNDDGNLVKLVYDNTKYVYTSEFQYFGDKITSLLSFTSRNSKSFDSTVTNCVYDDRDRPVFMIQDGFGDIETRDRMKTRFDYSGDRIVAVTDSMLGDIYTIHAANYRTFEYNEDGCLDRMDPHDDGSHFKCTYEGNVMTWLDCRDSFFSYNIDIEWEERLSSVYETARYAQTQPHIDGIISNEYNLFFLILFF